MQNDASFLATIEHPCTPVRLIYEFKEAWREFRESPKNYLLGIVNDAPQGSRRKSLLRFGLAIGLVFYAIVFFAILILWSLDHSRFPSAYEPGASTRILIFPGYRPKISGTEDDAKAAGGGGGGSHTITPPSSGQAPVFTFTPPLMAPRPEPQLHQPSLPVIETVMVDPRLASRRDDLDVTGQPDGARVPASAGPGSDGGIGTGARGGIGPGDGSGLGPGDDGNTGGSKFRIGVQSKPGHQQTVVDSLPVLLNRPRPLFTEEARKNKIQGVVRVKVLIDATGTVREVIVTRGLPDGLSEQAIRAAYEMRFRPAMKDGRTVSYWLNSVEVEFNLR
jgi:protein TonB